MMGQHAEGRGGVGEVLVGDRGEGDGGHLAAKVGVHDLGVGLVRAVTCPADPHHVQRGQRLQLRLGRGRGRPPSAPCVSAPSSSTSSSPSTTTTPTPAPRVILRSQLGVGWLGMGLGGGGGGGGGGGRGGGVRDVAALQDLAGHRCCRGGSCPLDDIRRLLGHENGVNAWQTHKAAQVGGLARGVEPSQPAVASSDLLPAGLVGAGDVPVLQLPPAHPRRERALVVVQGLHQLARDAAEARREVLLPLLADDDEVVVGGRLGHHLLAHV